MSRIFLRFLFILFFGIFLLSSVLSLGITPARSTIDFEPNLKQAITFEIINSEGKDLDLIGTIGGELGEYISLPIKEMHISAEEASKTFNYEISLPDSLSPGLHTGEIVIMESSRNKSQGSTQVLATLAVVTQLYVYVPYPGKYADGRIVIYNANQNEEVTFVFPVVSAGELDLDSVKAIVDIYDKMGIIVDSFETQSISVPSGEKREIVYKWNANVPIGEYRAVASLIYDEGTRDLEGIFRVGSKDVELKEIMVKDFKLGEIAKIEMLIENKWSELLSGVFIETKIKDGGENVVSSFQSASQNIDPLSEKIFSSYWDTAEVREGTYEVEVSINYADKSSNKNLKFKVDKNKLTIMGLGYVVSAGSGNGMLITVLIIVIIFLLLINLLWFFIFRKKLKKNSK